MKKEQVLLIEDDADIREGVRILLESENYCVEEAENGKSGLELLSDETDLVILDIMMPGMSGLRTCEEIRKVSNVPVLFLTAPVYALFPDPKTLLLLQTLALGLGALPLYLIAKKRIGPD